MEVGFGGGGRGRSKNGALGREKRGRVGGRGGYSGGIWGYKWGSPWEEEERKCKTRREREREILLCWLQNRGDVFG